jgi:peptide/nickel transport system substrate-binding protein
MMPEEQGRKLMNLGRFRYLAVPVALLAGAATLSACSSSSGSGSSSATFTTIDENTPITAGAPMNPFNTTNNTFPGYDSVSLAWGANNPANSNQTLPGLAKSWTLSPDGTALTVHLQPDAKWSNGQPVTANDIKLSAAIWFTQSTAQPYNLGSVTVVNSKTVTFTQTPGSHNNQFISGILQQPSNNWVVPASEYGKLLPSNIWTTINASLGSGSAATAAATTLATIGKKVVAFSPATDITAGPFAIKRINSGEALLVKNKYFYAASKVQPSQVVMLHYSGNQQIWSDMQSGRLDAAPYTAMPTNVLNQVKSAGNTQVNAPSLVAASLAFDQATYPYGMLPVRQALAYLINRGAVQKVGEGVSGVPSTTTTGVVSAALKDYISPSQISALNPYAQSTTKATSLLTAAHFTKKGSQWYLPNGKPWTITVNVPTGFSDWIAASSVLKSEFTSFGIPTSVKLAPDYPTYLTNIYKGTYAVAFWLTALGPGAYSTFLRLYGIYDGYVPLGNTLKRYPTADATATGGNFLNTPDTVSVPGLGTVNPGQLTYSLSNVNLSNQAGLSQQNAIMAKLIQATNYELPAIQLWDYINVQFVNNKRFSDWPTGNDAQLNLSPGVWMAYGYVHPK